MDEPPVMISGLRLYPMPETIMASSGPHVTKPQSKMPHILSTLQVSSASKMFLLLHMTNISRTAVSFFTISTSPLDIKCPEFLAFMPYLCYGPFSKVVICLYAKSPW